VVIDITLIMGIMVIIMPIPMAILMDTTVTDLAIHMDTGIIDIHMGTMATVIPLEAIMGGGIAAGAMVEAIMVAAIADGNLGNAKNNCSRANDRIL
jgi:hypothetical protein